MHACLHAKMTANANVAQYGAVVANQRWLDRAEASLAGASPPILRVDQLGATDLSGPPFHQYQHDPFWTATVTVSRLSPSWQKLLSPLLPHEQNLTGTEASEWLNDLGSSMLPYMTESATRVQNIMERWSLAGSAFTPRDYRADISPYLMLAEAQTRVDAYTASWDEDTPSEEEERSLQDGIITIRFLLIGLIASKVDTNTQTKPPPTSYMRD